MYGIDYLRTKLNRVRKRVNLRYDYYENKATHRMNNVVIPANIARMYRGKLGWCSLGVDALANRLVVDGFDYDPLAMKTIYNANNPDVLFSSAILGALITSCDFIYIQPVEGGIPRMQVIDGGNATGIIDPVTNLLTEGYAVLARDENGKTLQEAYFVPGRTEYLDLNTRERLVVETGLEYPLLVPIINRPDSRRYFGHSRISRTCMDVQNAAEDELTRINVLSEVASFPQKYILGLSNSTEGIDTIKASISSLLSFDKDEDGDKPTVGQFQQMNITPHVEAFKMYASIFAGETGLTMDDLGFVLSNPSSAEAIKAAHDSLKTTALKAQATFASGFVNAGYIASCLYSGINYTREEAVKTRIKWRPIIEPDAAMLSSIGDGAIKINQAIDGFFDAKSLEKLTGIESARGETNGLSTNSTNLFE